MSYRLQPIINIASLCAQHGINRIVLSPGSRVAPLTLAFTRHPKIKAYTISDERSAGFIAMGMAQQTDEAVVLACTSGTAAINYGPAIAEAFYQQVPLLIITADRPPEWVDQQDGQTIRQERLHLNHTKGNYQLPVDYAHPDSVWHIERTISEAINLANAFPKGPVHINAPFREPFYPQEGEASAGKVGKWIEEVAAEPQLAASVWSGLVNECQQFKKILIVGGQNRRDTELDFVLEKLGIPVVSDIISNLHGVKGSIKHQDAFLGKGLSDDLKKELQPDLLITFGKSVISKNLKLYLRAYRPQQHWHIQPAGQVADVYQSLTKIIRTSPTYFFREFAKRTNVETPDYQQTWQALDQQVKQCHLHYFNKSNWSELALVKQLLAKLPDHAQLHLSNSMPVRYANLINLESDREVTVWANRGTSGIDGTNSTSVGHALSNAQLHVLLTGDLSFLYDRNAFWHNYPLPNLRIVLLNNQGGVIFRMIDGPRKQKELAEYFVTKQALDASNLAKDFGFEYQAMHVSKAVNPPLDWLLAHGQTVKLLEIFTDSQQGQADYLGYKAHIQQLFTR
ncbi:MAG: 2-succinyl-5-enolpyruvyl-6-hydroxy-3-cyclohexene-1-carboxylic-acid synthase [Flammeovirgaceae bacterium]